MVAVSLMPPVDRCASCEGQKAESKARDIATAREAEAFEAPKPGADAQPSPGALPSPAADDVKANPVDTTARTLLSPDLAVQASLAGAESSQVDSGNNPALRLQALQAYGGAGGG